MTISGDHRRGRYTISAEHVHLVFVTKRRCSVFDADMLQCCQDAMHGHFLVPSYLAASCGGALLVIVRQYIEWQRRPG